MPPHNRSNPGQGSGPPRYPGTFLQALREAVAGLGWEIRRWIGDAVECRDPDGETHTVGLENLYRRARKQDRSEWPELITHFLTSVRAGEKEAAAQKDLAAQAERLLVRVGRPFAAGPKGPKLWSKPLGETDLVVNLVIDFPETMAYVNEESVAESGRSGEEWLAVAVANLRARSPEGCLRRISEDSTIHACNVGDSYDSSRALLLDTLLPDAPAGYLVALPHRDCLIVLPVALEAVPHMHIMKGLAQDNYKNAPYSISEEVYWVHNGAWHDFPIEFTDKNVVVTPPPEFVEVLNLLSGAAEGADEEDTEDDADDDAPPPG
jgi:hypothetical protein